MKANVLSIGIGLAAASHAFDLHAPPGYAADGALPRAAETQWPVADAPGPKIDELVVADLDALTREQPIPLAGAPDIARYGPSVPRFYCGAVPLDTRDTDLVCTVVGRGSESE